MASVTHAFSCAVPDDPGAAAAGQVLPSHWNAEHQVNLTPNDLSGPLAPYTWAGKPAAGDAGQRIRISDYGIAPGLIVVSDGTRWLVDGRQVLTRSTVNSTAITGTTTETTFSTGTFTIPADLLGPNGTLVVAPIVGFTSNANNKSVRIRYAGTVVAGWVGANQSTIQLPATIYNRGSASSQAGMWGTTATSIGFTTAAINTAVDVAVTITGQPTNTADSITLHGYVVEVLP